MAPLMSNIIIIQTHCHKKQAIARDNRGRFGCWRSADVSNPWRQSPVLESGCAGLGVTQSRPWLGKC